MSSRLSGYAKADLAVAMPVLPSLQRAAVAVGLFMAFYFPTDKHLLRCMDTPQAVLGALLLMVTFASLVEIRRMRE